MAAKVDMSNVDQYSSRRRSSSRLTKDICKGVKDPKNETENDRSRKKIAEKKLMNSDGKRKPLAECKPLVCVPDKKNVSEKEVAKNVRHSKKTEDRTTDQKMKKDSAPTKKHEPRTTDQKMKKDSAPTKKHEPRTTDQKMKKDSAASDNRKENVRKKRNGTDKLVEGGDCEFSKIESLIFEKDLKGKDQGKRGKNFNKANSKDVKVPAKKMKTSVRDKGKSTSKSNITVKKNEKSSSKNKSRDKVSLSDSELSDWEEVEDHRKEINEIEALLDDSEGRINTQEKSVKIELDAPDVLWGLKKRKKRSEDQRIEDYLRRHINRSIKEVHENMHKTHLLCLFAHGRYVNKTLNSEVLLGSALSLIGDKSAYPPKRLDMTYLEKFVNWFSKKITFKVQDLENDYWNIPLESLMLKRFAEKKAFSSRELALMFVIMCRALGMNVRLVLSLQPMTWKPNTDALLKRLKKEMDESKSNLNEPSCSKVIDRSEVESPKTDKVKVKNNRKMLSSESDVEVKLKKSSDKKKSHSKDILSRSPPSVVKKRRPSSSGDDESDSDFDPGMRSVKKGAKASVISKKRRSSEGKSDEGKKRKLDEKNDQKEGKKRKTEPLLAWAEVYVEEEEKWICVDVTRAKIHCIPEIESRIPSSAAYITAYNVNLTVKDVTRRYIASWLSNENKVRCCTKWWEKSLRPFRGARSRLDKEEDLEMDQNLRQQPLPKSIGEYKNHPLYALQRHLLKFEAIYPPDEAPVGYIRGEPVYARSSVYTLRSRDTWMKEAKTVRVGEEPYKIVKARPKWDRNTCQIIKDIPLEIFGEWQVEDFEPPVATGGKVPRNEYGNVELFKPTMLPRGCVHLPIPGLNRVARKLNIDCAPAMVGFDFHSGWTHPVYEGYVVCEEFKDTLLDAWNQEQAEQARREEEKRKKRIYDNWKKLIHGMMVRDRVRQKYGNVLPDTDDANKEEKAGKSREQTKGKSKTKEKKSEKKKVTQDDIDGARPPARHVPSNLRIDLASNVVDMAKESRRKTMKTSNSVKEKKEQERKFSLSGNTEGNLDDSSDETDEDEKKEKIRAVLQWGAKTVTSNPNLSDDSDNEVTAPPTVSKLPTLEDYKSLYALALKKTKIKPKRGKLADLEDVESNSSASSRSATPEPSEYLSNVEPRRLSRRSFNKKPVMYEESDDDGDISLDESDIEDKTYNPLKAKKDEAFSKVKGKNSFNLSESDSE